jgi:glutathione S-transferase
MAGLWPFMVLKSYQALNPRSAEYYGKKMEGYFGVKRVEDLVPEDKEAQEAMWAKARACFERVDGWYQKGKDEGPYLLGETICFADFAFAACATWPKRIWGENSAEWKDMKTWSEGRLGTLVDAFAKYETMM